MEFTRKEIVIKDSCILFDLVDLGIIKEFFQMEDLIAYTTPQVVAEITEEEQRMEITKYIDSKKLLIDTDGSYEAILLISEECPGLTFADASVLEVALRKRATVLSSDKSLRNQAMRRYLSLGGILWIIEQLVNKNIISVETAVAKLNLYPEINKRAPKDDIKNLIIKLSQ